MAQVPITHPKIKKPGLVDEASVPYWESKGWARADDAAAKPTPTPEPEGEDDPEDDPENVDGDEPSKNATASGNADSTGSKPARGGKARS